MDERARATATDSGAEPKAEPDNRPGEY